MDDHLCFIVPSAYTGEARDPVVQLERAVGEVLKQAASVASSGAGVWGMFAAYYAALGFHTSAREALFKQVPHDCLPLQAGAA